MYIIQKGVIYLFTYLFIYFFGSLKTQTKGVTTFQKGVVSRYMRLQILVVQKKVVVVCNMLQNVPDKQSFISGSPAHVLVISSNLVMPSFNSNYRHKMFELSTFQSGTIVQVYVILCIV